MRNLVNHIKIKEVSYKSKDGSITWTFPILLYIGFVNPFKPSPITKPWFSKIQAGGYHFLGMRIYWSRGAELRSKRVVK